MKKLLILISLLLILAAGFFLYYQEGILPVDKNSKVRTIFIIKPGESLTSIANNLIEQKLIRSRVVFYIVVKKLGVERSIQAGDFRLSSSMNSDEIVKALTHGTLDKWLTIIEGTRKEEIAQVVTQNLDIPESEFLKYAKEGYLFPDTYLVPKNATAVAVIKILESNFDKKFTPELKQEAARENLTVDQVIILASLVEREAHFPEDRQKVASVFLRRIKEHIALNVDATIQYALGYQPDEKTWWKKNLTTDDLALKSFYNTYLYPGLPPGPISNPGLASINAVLSADPQTPYLFYVSDSAGHLHFGRTIEEHNENIRKYVR